MQEYYIAIKDRDVDRSFKQFFNISHILYTYPRSAQCFGAHNVSLNTRNLVVYLKRLRLKEDEFQGTV